MDYYAILEPIAVKHGLDPYLVEAQIIVESNGDPYAWKPEQRYRYFWDVRTKRPFRAVTDAENISEFPPADFHSLAASADQEWWAQQASWGLMQIMGAVAREHGFIGKYLTQLTDPLINMQLGCAHIADLTQWARAKYTGPAADAANVITRAVLAAYNGGKGGNAPDSVPDRNREYAQKVLNQFARIRPN